MMKINHLLSAAAISMIFLAPAIASAETISVTADLRASSEVPPKDSQGYGKLKGTYDTESKQLQWKVRYAELTGPASMAHFHGPAAVGQNAGVVIPIDPSKLPSPIEGSATLSDAQAQQLLAGMWYFNVHTAANPGGEIRGQVMPKH